MDSITLSKFLFFSSFIIWLFPPVRQYRSRHFLFFLLLATSDALNLGVSYLFRENLSGIIHSVATYLMIISLLENTVVKKNRIAILLIFTVVLTFNIFIKEVSFYYSLIIINYFIITFIVLKNFIVTYVDTRIMNLFLIVLLFYLSTTLLKLFNILIGFADATAFFFITSIAQIAFGLFFSIFRENNKRLMVQL